jgi:hypothetical protein
MKYRLEQAFKQYLRDAHECPEFSTLQFKQEGDFIYAEDALYSLIYWDILKPYFKSLSPKQKKNFIRHLYSTKQPPPHLR